MKKILASALIGALFLALFGVSLKIVPVVFSDVRADYREVWKLLNVTNLSSMSDKDVDINITMNLKKGVYIACSANITEYFKAPPGGYSDWMEWLNGTGTLPYHWGDMDWFVSNGSVTPITYDQIQHWGNMYLDTGNVPYWTFMGNTYMADCDLTRNYDDPDMISVANWTGNTIKIIDDLRINKSKTANIAFKIVITEPGLYTFNITATTDFTLSETSWVVGGATTLLVPYEYTTIQEAVNVANPNFTIIVSNGVYNEQVVINKSLTIQGMGSSTIIKPSSTDKLETILDGHFWGGTKQIAGIIVANATTGSSVMLKNLTVNGESITAKPAGADYVAGVFYRETGGTIDTVTVTNMTIDATGTAVRGFGVYISAISNAVSVEVKGCTITDYDKNGIDAHGNKLAVNIHHNTVTGRGPLPNGDEVQNGILIMDGAAGTVSTNIISNMSYTPETWWSAGVMFFDSAGSAVNNIITQCQIGVIFQDGNGSAQGNTVNGGTVGLIDLWAQYTKGGAWTASFLNNTVSGAKDSPGYENGAIGAQTWSEGASLTVTIRDNRLTNGSTSADGIYIGDIPEYGPAGNITVSILNNNISNWQHGIRFVSSVNVPGSRVKYNNIIGNQLSGILSNCPGILDASFNWWGDETGPYHPTLNPSGKGNSVSDNVLFEPWLVKPYAPGQVVPVSVVYVDPNFVNLTAPALGTTFAINVNIANVTLMYGVQFTLEWNSTLLNLTSTSPHLPTPWVLYNCWINQTKTASKYILAMAPVVAGAPAFNGSTSLVSLNFQTIIDPIYPDNLTCILNLTGVKLGDVSAKPIPRLVYSGNYSCYSTMAKLLLMPTNPKAYKVPTEFAVNVTVANIVSLYSFEFNLTYNQTLLNIVRVQNPPGIPVPYQEPGTGSIYIRVDGITPTISGNKTLITITFKVMQGFAWSTETTSVNCTLAFDPARTTLNLSNPVNYEAVAGTYSYVPLKGDVYDMNGVVDIYDLLFVANKFLTEPGGPPYDRADQNRDGKIDILDVILVARNFGAEV